MAIDFNTTFQALTGNPPLTWQKRLFSVFRDRPASEWPTHIDLPTGLGKTSTIHLWLIALAQQITSDIVTLPRRLIYVVNRRTVVDQATDIAEEIKKRPPLEGFDKDWFTVSTLRGQFADNGEWSANHGRPAIIVGTVDMIGSRLLFSGYGRGYRHRPLHAGFLGQDSLLIHDEAHLEPAFQKLLNAIKDEQTRCKEFRPFHILPLTATTREDSPRPFTLEPEDYQQKIVQQRMEAAKTLTLHPLNDEKKTAETVAQLALKRAEANPNSAILVFVRRVDDVKKVDEIITKAKVGKTLQLTGTMRGERDKLVEKPVFLRYRPTTAKNAEPGTVFLICTSAGEVGIDISADHLICDLTTYESMAQRFGRVNRYGNGHANIDIAHINTFKTDDDYDTARERTLRLLEKLNGNASPKALMQLPSSERAAAFAPLPKMLTTSPIFFDTLALTTICKSLAKLEELPGRPPIADWLHGVPEDWQPAETQVTWRREVEWLTKDILVDYPPDDLLDTYPLKPHEILKDQSRRVLKELAAIADRVDAKNTFVWLQNDKGTRRHTLQYLAQQDENFIADCIVILPPSAGGLTIGGMLSGNAEFNSEIVYDIADLWFDENGEPIRSRIWDDDPVPPDMRQVLKLSLRSDDDFESSEDAEKPLTAPLGNVWRWYELQDNEDSEASRSAEKPVAWQTHTDDVEKFVRDILGGLLLPSEIAAALIVAARLHDLGKKRELFQRILGNPDPDEPWAKSGAKNGGIRSRYRHELGSLLDLPSHPEFQTLSDDMKDLVRHLIATHHGRARPHFPSEESFDPNYTDAQVHAALAQVSLRFARLQKRYGRWGLAYLESLLRAADCAASAHPSAYIKELEEVQA